MVQTPRASRPRETESDGVEYEPLVLADWTDPVPLTVAQAIDDLAANAGGNLSGANLAPIPSNWIRRVPTDGQVGQGNALPSSGVEIFPGLYLVGGIGADRPFQVGWMLPATFPTGTMELFALSTMYINPASARTIRLKLEHEDFADGGDLNSVSFANEGTEDQAYGTSDQFKVKFLSHVFGTVPTAGRPLICKLTFTNTGNDTVAGETTVWQFFLRWVP